MSKIEHTTLNDQAYLGAEARAHLRQLPPRPDARHPHRRRNLRHLDHAGARGAAAPGGRAAPGDAAEPLDRRAAPDDRQVHRALPRALRAGGARRRAGDRQCRAPITCGGSRRSSRTSTRRSQSATAAAYLLLNQKFHFLIYERAESPLLQDFIQDLWSQVGPFFNELFEDTDYLPHANEYHLRIVAALEAGDAAGVRQAIVDDISTAAHSLMPRLKEVVAAGPRAARG